MNDHLSDLALDRALDANTTPAHCDTCETCRRRLAELSAARAAFTVRPPMRAPTLTRTRPRALAPTLALAIAALALLTIRTPAPDTVRPKGQPATLTPYLQRAPDTLAHALAPSDPVRPGDVLQWVVTLHEPRWVAILGRDGSGVSARYWPRAASAQYLEAGVDQVLDASLTLDATAGAEEIRALFCRAPIALEPLPLDVPDGCDEQRLVLEKRP